MGEVITVLSNIFYSNTRKGELFTLLYGKKISNINKKIKPEMYL